MASISLAWISTLLYSIWLYISILFLHPPVPPVEADGRTTLSLVLVEVCSIRGSFPSAVARYVTHSLCLSPHKSCSYTVMEHMAAVTVRGSVYTGQVASPAQGHMQRQINRTFSTMTTGHLESPISLTTALNCGRKPEKTHPEVCASCGSTMLQATTSTQSTVPDHTTAKMEFDTQHVQAHTLNHVSLTPCHHYTMNHTHDALNTGRDCRL